MTEDYKWEQLVAQYFSDDCSEEVIGAIQEVIKQYPEKKKEFEQLKETWEKTGEFELKWDKERSWDNIETRISGPGEDIIPIYEFNRDERIEKRLYRYESSPSRKENRWKWFLRIAAVILLVSGISYTAIQYESTKRQRSTASANRFMQQITTDRGERARVSFSDGTHVDLNSSSAIRFPDKFTGNIREVELVEGEAYFDVAHNEKIPFLVYSRDVEIQVLGTQFNVNAAHNEQVQVTVAEGKVAVKATGKGIDAQKPNADRVELTRGYFTEVKPGKLPSKPSRVNLELHFGWVKSLLVFDNTPFVDVISKLKNYYDIDFKVADNSLYDKKLTAVFEHESLARVLEVISLTLSIEYERKESMIIFKPATFSVENE